MERFKAVVHAVSYSLCFAGMCLAIPLMLLTVADVVGRSFLDKPVPGAFELSEYLLSVMILLGAAYTQQVKGHVGVDFLTRRLSPRGQALAQAVTILACLTVVTILVGSGFLEAVRERAVSDQLRVPQWPFKLLVCVGGSFLWLELWIDLVSSVGRIVGRRP
jgi:TRAP-type C4-dicarboxylate transport system permease small subunit